MGKCGYGAKLTLTLSGGEQVIAYKGTDSCDTISFGSCQRLTFSAETRRTRKFRSIFGMGRMPNSNEVMLNDGGTAYAALYARQVCTSLGKRRIHFWLPRRARREL